MYTRQAPPYLLDDEPVKLSISSRTTCELRDSMGCHECICAVASHPPCSACENCVHGPDGEFQYEDVCDGDCQNCTTCRAVADRLEDEERNFRQWYGAPLVSDYKEFIYRIGGSGYTQHKGGIFTNTHEIPDESAHPKYLSQVHELQRRVYAIKHGAEIPEYELAQVYELSVTTSKRNLRIARYQ